LLGYVLAAMAGADLIDVPRTTAASVAASARALLGDDLRRNSFITCLPVLEADVSVPAGRRPCDDAK
jgi:hypothetical protein